MMSLNILVELTCLVVVARGTVDLTLPEVQHLATHLTRDECRRLVASLHFNSFKLEHYKTLEDAENALPDDVSCLKLLLEWNSGDGRGKTHEKLSLRLRELERHDLASWLDSTVLNELEGEINKVVQEFTESSNDRGLSPIQVFENPDDLEMKFIRNDEMWVFVPGITVIIFIVAFILLSIYLANEVMRRYRLSKLGKVDEEYQIQ